MSTAGSVRSGDAAAPYTPDAGAPPPGKPPRRKRTRIFRWEGLIPLVLFAALGVVAYKLFAERFIRDVMAEAGTKALGTEMAIADLKIDEMRAALELRDLAIADPFDPNRNLIEAGLIRVELEPEPLLQKKLIVRRLTIGDVRTGTRRTTPARPVAADGFAPRALVEMDRWKNQFDVPPLSLLPVDQIRAVALDPMQLRTVRAAFAIAADADSLKDAIEARYADLRIQQTLDSTTALVNRLRGINVRTLNVAAVRGAVDDARRGVARVDSAKLRVEALAATARAGIDTLQAGVRALDAAKVEDYAFARGLLKLPSFDAPEIGAALFGAVTIDRFQQALYWATLAREYTPPGLLPKEHPGPKRLRASGTTVQFVNPKAYPRFHLRNATLSLEVGGGEAAGEYAMAISDLTTEPALVGKPTLFALRRVARGSDLDSLVVRGMMDRTGNEPRDVLTVLAAGIKLPVLPMPTLPYRADPGRGASELRLVIEGDRINGRWALNSSELAWRLDSARARPLNTMESLVMRVITGVRTLDMAAEITGEVKSPKLSVRSNLDRQIADRLRAVAGEEVRAAEARVRAEVDRLVEEKSAPVRARVAELRADTDRRIADARTRLDEERARLQAQLDALSGGLINLPRLPGD